MNDLPNFTPYGYRLLEVISNNRIGGRITYQAFQLSTNDYVIIKQFNFASSKNWDLYKQIEQEINVLKSLDYIGIPNYIETIDHSDGICFVQQYIDAPNLSISRSFDTEQIKSIATQLLEILVYLQNRVPPIIHRDIKPENVLYDTNNEGAYHFCKLAFSRGAETLGLSLLWVMLLKSGKVYLVDFGLARIGNNEIALSSMIGGTPGFMPPEQFLQQELSNASDLYSLGATIICLVTGIKSTHLNTIVDGFTINFQSKVSQYNLRFVKWLEKMVKPKMEERFSDAKEALKVLNGIDDLIMVPEVNIEQSQLVFKANKSEQRLTQILTIRNTVPDTLLKGKWSVAYHKKDGLHTPDDHAFISFSPKEFEGNNIRCQVTVDTSKLQSSQKGKRTIILESNAGIEKSSIPVEIETAPRPVTQPQIPGWYWLRLGILLMVSVVLVQFLWPIEWGIINTTLVSILQSRIINTILGKIGEINLWLRETGMQSWKTIGMIGLIVIGAIISEICILLESYNNTFNRRHHSTYYRTSDDGAKVLFGGAMGGAIGGGIGVLLGLVLEVFMGMLKGGMEGIEEIDSIIELVLVVIMAIAIVICFVFFAIVGAICFAIIGAIIGEIVGIIILAILFIIQAISRGLVIVLSPILVPINRMSRLGFNRNITSIHLLLTCVAGASMGWLHLAGINIYAILCLAGSSILLASMLIYPQIKHRKLIARYRREEQNLIEL
ncbi:MAG: serine/threonine protein kinase [Crocosphaera sp.]